MTRFWLIIFFAVPNYLLRNTSPRYIQILWLCQFSVEMAPNYLSRSTSPRYIQILWLCQFSVEMAPGNGLIILVGVPRPGIYKYCGYVNSVWKWLLEMASAIQLFPLWELLEVASVRFSEYLCVNYDEVLAS